MADPDPGEVTELLRLCSTGDKTALDEVVRLVYCELRRLAAAQMRRERGDHTLQPTALVNEAYLRLARQPKVTSQNRVQFLAIAANLMRQILVGHARRHRAAKRGSGKKVELNENAGAVSPMPVDFVALDAALKKLARVDKRQSRIVELRFFGGMTEEEIADLLGVSTITVKREWRIARAALRRELMEEASASEKGT